MHTLPQDRRRGSGVYLCQLVQKSSAAPCPGQLLHRFSPGVRPYQRLWYLFSREQMHAILLNGVPELQ